MPKVSVIIPTCNRPELLDKAIGSVLNQSYQDFEIIVVDDGLIRRANEVIKNIGSNKIRYIQHEINRGGGAARNTGIKVASGEYVAFLDDDDEWLPKKLEIQMRLFEKTSNEVGFCISAVTNLLGDHNEITKVYDGIKDFKKDSLQRFKGFLTVTLVIKKYVFEDVGMFDENLPSHQEAELIIRVAEKYKGLGINVPLVNVNMNIGHDHIGSNFSKRILGREIVLEKHKGRYKNFPKVLARHYFQLGIWCRDNKENKKARLYFFRAWQLDFFKIRYLAHFFNSFI